MRDIDVRLAVRERLTAAHFGDADTRIVEEMGVWNGAVRIDLAVINGEISGFELKSARDTLQRLPSQCAIYSQVFDRCCVVTADNHLKGALEIVPEWWGVLVATTVSDRLLLAEMRASSCNPAVSPIQLARLLWRAEALQVLKAHNLDRGLRSAPVARLAEVMADALPLPVLARSVRRCLKDRQNWLGQPVGNERDMTVRGNL